MNVHAPAGRAVTPFDQAGADRLMEEAGLDLLLVSSKHNAQYLLGGYKFIFFSAMDAIGHSRYLPLVLYRRGRPDHAAYVANKMEGGEHHVSPFWTPNFLPAAWGTLDAATLAVEHVRKIGMERGRVGFEPAFMPADAYLHMTRALPGAEWADATGVLERLRAVKTPQEIRKLKTASELITDAMIATAVWAREGSTKREIIERLRGEETLRGLHFEYCLLKLGPSHNRAASNQAWAEGEVLSIDSGGNFEGYIGDLCRMGVLGEPDAELEDLLAQVDAVQQAAFSPIRAGAAGAEAIACAEGALRGLPSAAFTDFFIHGMGLISHEAPFLITNHPVAYEGTDADKPLEAGMVLSVETAMLHPTRGFIKLEDTVAVTADGCQMFGEKGRGWNRGEAR